MTSGGIVWVAGNPAILIPLVWLRNLSLAACRGGVS